MYYKKDYYLFIFMKITSFKTQCNRQFYYFFIQQNSTNNDKIILKDKAYWTLKISFNGNVNSTTVANTKEVLFSI
jgi:hypothetical protein